MHPALVCVAATAVAALALILTVIAWGSQESASARGAGSRTAESPDASPGWTPFASHGGGSAAGRVRFVRNARTDFDPFILGADKSQRSFIRTHYWRLRGYPPTSDTALGWAPPVHFYSDLYALYPSNSSDRGVIERHPDWILRNAEGNPLYVPFECSDGTCAAYAADPGNPQWRAHWIRDAHRQLRKGYRGVFIDNVNLLMRVSDGDGTEIAPIDPRTGQAMTELDWRGYVADFTRRIRRDLSRAEIVHNAIWFADQSDPAAWREIAAADLIELERGFSEPALIDGDGSAYADLLAYVDLVHSRGTSVLLEPYDLDPSTRLFELASYFLVNAGRDAIASDYEADPGDWWPGWEAKLGAPLGPRYFQGAVLRRDFERGVALVNPPGGAEQTVSLGGTYLDLEGVSAEQVTLGPGEGAVLVAAG